MARLRRPKIVAVVGFSVVVFVDVVVLPETIEEGRREREMAVMVMYFGVCG